MSDNWFWLKRKHRLLDEKREREMKLNEAIDKAFNNIMTMSADEFDKELEKHKDGDVAIFLEEIKDFSESEYYCKALKKGINNDSN